MTFPPHTADVAMRVRRLRDRFDTLGVDAMVVTNPTNVRWLTTFTGSNASAFVDRDRLVVLTDSRYRDQAPAELDAAGVQGDVEIGHDLVGSIADLVRTEQRIGLEADDVSWAVQQELSARIGSQLVSTSHELVKLRATKDAGELERIRAAANIADESLAEVAPILADEPTERVVARALDDAMKDRGATGPAYETIVASGPRAALPHARPTDRVIRAGDLVIIDVGAVVDGYRSDMTRTFVVGEPSTDQQRMLDVVLAAQRLGKAAVRGGVSAREVDATCRDLISETGWGDEFSHGTGHGVGLDIHEHPRLSSRTEDVLEPGMVVTVEPGIYLRDLGGVRWEDLLVVTPDGFEVLTHSPKDPVVA